MWLLLCVCIDCSKKYYDDCSNVLATLMIRAMFPRYNNPVTGLSPGGSDSVAASGIEGTLQTVASNAGLRRIGGTSLPRTVSLPHSGSTAMLSDREVCARLYSVCCKIDSACALLP